MNNKAPDFLKALDIWVIIKSHIAIDEDYAIQEATLQLEFGDKDSYVDVKYYDLSETIEAFEPNEEPGSTRIRLSPLDVDKMYRNIEDVVRLPQNVMSLRVHLDHAHVALFEIKMLPEFR